MPAFLTRSKSQIEAGMHSGDEGFSVVHADPNTPRVTRSRLSDRTAELAADELGRGGVFTGHETGQFNGIADGPGEARERCSDS